MSEMYQKFELPDENDYQPISKVEDVIQYSPKSRRVAALLALMGYHKLYLGLSKSIFGSRNSFGNMEDYYRLKNGEEFYDGEGRLLR